jgi:hypothetical protein
LNSIIHHATPSSLTQAEINQILAYYTDHPLPEGFTALQGGGTITGGAQEGSLRKALEDYNQFFDEAQEYPRNFRRLLGKIMPREEIRRKNFLKIKKDKLLKIIKDYKKEKLKLEEQGEKENSMYKPEKIKELLDELEADKDRKISEAANYKSVQKMTDDLNNYFYSNSTYKYPEDIETLEAIEKQIDNYDVNKKEKKRKEIPKSTKEKLVEIDKKMNDNYFVYASLIFSPEDARKMLEEDIKYPSAKKDSSSSDESNVNQIVTLPISTEALPHKGGKSKRNKSRQRRNTKKKQNKLIKRRFSQRKQNKKGRSRKIR